MILRPEQPQDHAGIYEVNSRAFFRPDQPGPVAEAELVDRLRSAGVIILSLVAVDGEQVIGHILFSQGSIHTEDSHIAAVALAPMAVLPEYQQRGIGSQLVREGINRLRQDGHERVCVLGHADYYPRFGFVRARSTYSIACEYDVPDEVFMALELKPGAFKGITGTFFYHPEFRGV